jgi:hypothetical protein
MSVFLFNSVIYIFFKLICSSICIQNSPVFSHTVQSSLPGICSYVTSRHELRVTQSQKRGKDNHRMGQIFTDIRENRKYLDLLKSLVLGCCDNERDW